MGLDEITFTGLIQNRKLSDINGPEFLNAVMACGWKEGTGTHFFQQLRKDGPSRGINTPGDLVRAIAAGTSEPGSDGKTIHRICNGSAYIVYNAATRTLITFSQGDPTRKWDVEAALVHLRQKAMPPSAAHPFGAGHCAAYVQDAIKAGGVTVPKVGSGSAKDYGFRLKLAGFVAQSGWVAPYQKGDVAVIDGFAKTAAKGIKHDHLDGHMAMWDGVQWISDYKQSGAGPYPGSDYDKAKPKFVIYRYPQ
jgi:hypothetical protein